jgi:hypothetical protein
VLRPAGGRQAATLDELMTNVKEALSLHLEDENPADCGLSPDASILARFETHYAFLQ